MNYFDRMALAADRYDMPAVPTRDLVAAIHEVTDHLFPSDSIAMYNLLDIIHQIIPEPTVQDVKIATFLIGEDYEPDAIRWICISFQQSKDLMSMTVKPEHREALAKILEAK